MEKEEFIEKMAKLFSDLEEILFSQEVTGKILDGYDDDEIESAIAAIKYMFTEDSDSLVGRWIRAYLSKQNSNEQDFITNRVKSLREVIIGMNEKDFGRIGIFKKLAEKRQCKLDAAIDVAMLELSMSKINEEEGKYRKASAN